MYAANFLAREQRCTIHARLSKNLSSILELELMEVKTLSPWLLIMVIRLSRLLVSSA